MLSKHALFVHVGFLDYPHVMRNTHAVILWHTFGILLECNIIGNIVYSSFTEENEHDNTVNRNLYPLQSDA